MKNVGCQIILKDDFILDNRGFWVGLKAFSKKQDAEALRDRLYKEGKRTWVLEDVVKLPQGKIKIFDEKGRFVGESTLPVKITSGSKIVVEDCPYKGSIEMHISDQGRLCVVNRVGIGEYLRGIVPREINPNSPLEALKAQAVTARGETISKLGKRHTPSPYDFCAAQHCQVYAGLERQTPTTNQAVAETEGEVLFYKDEIVDTVYHGNCGGHTENNENVWVSQPDPSLRGVRDYEVKRNKFPSVPGKMEEWLTNPPSAYCSHQEGKFRWRQTYKAEELNKIINETKDAGKIKDIVLGERGVSGRLKDIEIIGTKGNFTIHKEYPIRKILGGLNSAAFILQIKRDQNGQPIEFCFIGGGWGHGVGMCQSGAIGMARAGKPYKEILRYYYSNIQIRKLY